MRTKYEKRRVRPLRTRTRVVVARPVVGSDQERRRVQPGHTGTPLGEPVRDAPVPTGKVEHLHPRLKLEHAPDHLRLGITRLGELRLIEVELVLVEDLADVKRGL